ncbi:transposase domain-containing protein [Vibrio spartinae]|uniref:Bacteriophage Mu transposase n=1 Tax=Vibrio spartinae TaxID=1918945 RepID=A0A1N6M5V9_9VIBR|nr:transposase domain-containing protein [Vibrio spartinae]SIO94825.1 Bacteriophage Mu transposase [Vibrio spartinae]
MWVQAKELINLAGLPGTPQGISYKARTGGWVKRNVEGVKGRVYEYLLSSLPASVQSAVLKKQNKIVIDNQIFDIPKQRNAQEKYSAEALWDRYNKSNAKSKEKAQKALLSVRAVKTLLANKVPAMDAYDAISDEYSVPTPTLRRHVKKVEGIEESDWLPALLSGHCDGAKARRENQFAEISPDAWAAFKADYLRLERPSIAKCYERLLKAAKEHDWIVPSVKSITRRIEKEIPMQQRVLLREGEHALLQMYPPQERSVADLHAMEWINGDGYQHNVFVKWFNGEVLRPKTWFWQDVHTRKIVGWRCDISENTDSIRLSLMDVCQRYGIPKEITIDNTRAAANKWMTGGVPNRYRFKVKDDDPMGIIPMLGIKLHWSSVILGKGHGQAKPIERAFGVGGLDEYIDKHPSLAGAYTGPNPMAKPDNYGSTAIDADVFLQTIASGVEMYNERQNRQTEVCRGFMSFDEAFRISYENAPIRKATSAQIQLMMLQAEAVRVSRHGTIVLESGGSLAGRKNRYFNEKLMDLVGKKVVARFDPQQLHESVEIYTLNGVHMFTAECLDKAGFGDTQAAREHKRKRTQFTKAHKAAAQAQQEMSALEAAAMLPEPEDDTPPESRVVEVYRPSISVGNTAIAASVHQNEPEEDYEENFQNAVASLMEQRRKNRL